MEAWDQKPQNLQRNQEKVSGLSPQEIARYRRLKISKQARRFLLGILTLGAGITNVNKIDYIPQKYRQLTTKNNSDNDISSIQDSYAHVDQSIDYVEINRALDVAVNQYADQLPAEITRTNFRNLLLAIATIETGLRNRPRALNQIPLISEKMILNGGNRTRGIMQSDVTQPDTPTYESGFVAGADRLIKNLQLYSNDQFRTEELSAEMIITFAVADYLTGRGSSWRAGIQQSLTHQGYMEPVVYDGRIGPNTTEALINFFEHHRQNGSYFNQANYDYYLRRIKEASTEHLRTWWTVTELLDARPIIPTIGVTNNIKKQLMTYSDEPTTASDYVEKVIEVYDLLTE